MVIDLVIKVCDAKRRKQGLIWVEIWDLSQDSGSLKDDVLLSYEHDAMYHLMNMTQRAFLFTRGKFTSLANARALLYFLPTLSKVGTGANCRSIR